MAVATPDLDQSRRYQLPARHAQRRQRRVVRGAGGQQPGGGLAGDEQRGEREDQGEQRERYRFGQDRVLDRGRLGADVGGEREVPGGGKLAREGLCPLYQRLGRCRGKCDLCPAEAHVLRAKLVEQRRAGQDSGDFIPFGNGETDPRVTTMPTTRSRSRRDEPTPATAAGRPSRTARIVSALPSCTTSMPPHAGQPRSHPCGQPPAAARQAPSGCQQAARTAHQAAPRSQNPRGLATIAERLQVRANYRASAPTPGSRASAPK